MSQVKIINNTAFEYQTLFATDEKGNPIVTPIIKGTFAINLDGTLEFLQQQLPVNLEGEFYADPATSSYLYEPECAFVKPKTDVVVLGAAISSNGPVNALLVDIQVGHLQKKLKVTGDRYWIKQGKSYALSKIIPFETMPLNYENAFGGWDRRFEDEARHGFEARNTVGKGFYLPDAPYTEPLPLANIEDPLNSVQKITDRPEPAGCGFTLPHWQPRAALAGTYDDEWIEKRSPMLPADFKKEYFNAASSDLMADNFLQGNERVSITNMTPGGHLDFYLPGVNPPVCMIELKNKLVELNLNLDTIIINTEQSWVSLLWRNYQRLDDSYHDVEEMSIVYG